MDSQALLSQPTLFSAETKRTIVSLGLSMELRKAIAHGDIGAAIRCVAAGASPKALFKGLTPLMEALLSGQTAIAMLLIPLSDLSVRDPHGRNPLMLAASAGDLQCIEAMLPLCDALAPRIGDRDRHGATALIHLAMGGALPASQVHESMRAMAAKALLPNSNPKALTKSVEANALLWAIQRSRPQLVALLAPVSDHLLYDDDEGSPLCLASSKGCAATLASLLGFDQFLDVHAKCGHDSANLMCSWVYEPKGNPLIVAAKKGSLECCQLLLRFFSPSAEDAFKRKSALEWALCAPDFNDGHAACAELFISAIEDGSTIRKALLACVQHGRDREASLILERLPALGLSVIEPASPSFPSSPLLAAISARNDHLAALLAPISDLSVRADGRSLIDLAVLADLPHCAKAMLDSGSAGLLSPALIYDIIHSGRTIQIGGDKLISFDAPRRAARLQCLEMILPLIDQSQPSPNWSHPISAAALHGDLATFKMLSQNVDFSSLEDIAEASWGGSFLTNAMVSQSIEMVHAILSSILPPRMRLGITGSTPLISFCYNFSAISPTSPLVADVLARLMRRFEADHCNDAGLCARDILVGAKSPLLPLFDCVAQATRDSSALREIPIPKACSDGAPARRL